MILISRVFYSQIFIFIRCTYFYFLIAAKIVVMPIIWIFILFLSLTTAKHTNRLPSTRRSSLELLPAAAITFLQNNVSELVNDEVLSSYSNSFLLQNRLAVERIHSIKERSYYLISNTRIFFIIILLVYFFNYYKRCHPLFWFKYMRYVEVKNIQLKTKTTKKIILKKFKIWFEKLIYELTFKRQKKKNLF